MRLVWSALRSTAILYHFPQTLTYTYSKNYSQYCLNKLQNRNDEAICRLENSVHACVFELIK